MAKPTPLPRDMTTGPFHVQEADAFGISRSRLRRSDLERPHHGVRVQSGGKESWAGRCAAALAAVPEGAVLAGMSVLKLCGAELPYWVTDDERIHLIPSHRHSRSQLPGLVLHQRARPLLSDTTIGGLPCQHPAEAWAQVVAGTTRRAAIMLAEGLMRRGQEVCEVAEFHKLYSLVTGRRGAKRVRECVPFLSSGTDSIRESDLRILLGEFGLHGAIVNAALVVGGITIARPDLRFEKLKLVFEYDGDMHRRNKKVWREDIQRRERMKSAGYDVVTVIADDLEFPQALFARITRLRPGLQLVRPLPGRRSH